MSRCSQHKEPNNKHGFCPGCERDPRLLVRLCANCNNPFVQHKGAHVATTCCGATASEHHPEWERYERE